MRRISLVALGLGLLLVFDSPQLAHSEPRHDVYVVKTAFVLNFVRLIVWPDEALPAPGDPLVIGVFGREPFDGAVDELSRWMHDHLGPHVPLHFTAFHPDFRMRDRPPTPPQTLSLARRIAMENGLHSVYTGNVHDPVGQSTGCAGCGLTVIGRDRYDVTAWRLTDDGRCTSCDTPLPGVFEGAPGDWGSRRLPVRLADYA